MIGLSTYSVRSGVDTVIGDRGTATTFGKYIGRYQAILITVTLHKTGEYFMQGDKFYGNHLCSGNDGGIRITRQSHVSVNRCIYCTSRTIFSNRMSCNNNY